MPSSHLPAIRCLACAGWFTSVGAGGLAVATELVLWMVVIVIMLSVAIASTVSLLILTHLPPIAAVYQIARRVPCDCVPPRLPAIDRSAIGGNVIPLRRSGALDNHDN